MGLVAPCLALVFLLWATNQARAASIESKERAAQKTCLAGDYAKGVAILAELYMRTRDANYIYNQARCFEQNGKYEEAIARFREYQHKREEAKSPPDDLADKRIAACQALLDRNRPVAPSPVAKPAEGTAASVAVEPPPPSAGPAFPVREPQPVPPVVSPSPSAPAAPGAMSAGSPAVEVSVASSGSASNGTALRVAGIATAALGVAGIATGVVLQLKVNSLTDELEASSTSYSRDKESTRQSYKTGSLLAYGLGAACLVGGSVLYYVGYRAGKSTQVAVLPAAGPHLLGLALKEAF